MGKALPIQMARWCFVALVGSVSVGCAATSPTVWAQVPPEAPDSMPSTLMQDANFVEDRYGDLLSTSHLYLVFEPSASQAERQEAVDLVNGRVVGGVAGPVEGMYIVEVSGDGTLETMDSVIERLLALPQVSSAEKLSVVGGG